MEEHKMRCTCTSGESTPVVSISAIKKSQMVSVISASTSLSSNSWKRVDSSCTVDKQRDLSMAVCTELRQLRAWVSHWEYLLAEETHVHAAETKT